MRPRCARAGVTLIELLVVMVIVGLLAALLLPAIQQTREASRKTQCRSNLRQIGVAVEGYQTAHRMFPPGNSNEYSLHVFILPYLGEGPLYSTVDFGVVASRSRLRTRTAPEVYICPSDAGIDVPGRGAPTSYAGNFGTGVQRDGYNGMFHNLRVAGPLLVQHVTDGLSQTAAISECLTSDGSRSSLRPVWNTPQRFLGPDEVDTFASYCDSIPTDALLGDLWTKGRPWVRGDAGFTLYNHVLPPKRKSCFNGTRVQQGSYSASSAHPGGVYVLFGDGRAAFIADGVDLTVWRALGSRDGGEVVAAP